MDYEEEDALTVELYKLHWEAKAINLSIYLVSFF